MPTSNRNLPRPVDIVYKRLPNDVHVYPGTLRQATSSRLVIESPIAVTAPRKILDGVIADAGFLAIWFIYRHRWYDVGKFYDKDRNFLGYYCDIIKPVTRLLSSGTRTATITDLFLDLWVTKDHQYTILDENEFDTAQKKGYITKTVASQARKQLSSLIRRVRTKQFPPESIRILHPQ